ncbi:hypothetical protein YC2023_009443 [Brassica napus]
MIYLMLTLFDVEKVRYTRKRECRERGKETWTKEAHIKRVLIMEIKKLVRWRLDDFSHGLAHAFLDS